MVRARRLLAVVELSGGNIRLLGVAAVIGFRRPPWSFVILTKVTPGIGLLWFVVRRGPAPAAGCCS